MAATTLIILVAINYSFNDKDIDGFTNLLNFLMNNLLVT